MIAPKNGHNFYVCPPDCAGCMFCEHSMTWCTICHGAEGTLPTNCPGCKMPDDLQIAVGNGKVDFDGKNWVEVKKK